MAYSSIAHMGFALMGLAAGTAQGVEAMLIYMAIYVTMNIGTFAFILTMERTAAGHRDRALDHVFASRAGQGAGAAGADVQPGRCAAAGGLLRQVRGAAGGGRCGLAWLAVAGVIASVIGAFYYLRIVYLCISARRARGWTGMPPAYAGLMASARSWCWGS
jgi:NADH-quinone oxidoreductase subunit N